MTELLTAMFITCEVVEWQKKLYPLLKCFDLHPPQPIIQIAIWGTNMHNIQGSPDYYCITIACKMVKE
jgi:hypothetical protein